MEQDKVTKASINSPTNSIIKQKPPAAGMGRKKGAVNKVNKEIKEMLMAALNSAGGEQYFLVQAYENPTAFMSLIGKIIPREIKAELNTENNSLAERLKVARERVGM